MDNLQTLNTLGLSLPSPAYLIGAILFGILGYAAYRYGKKSSLSIPKWLGVALMLYPYAVSDTTLLYIIGALLCAGVYFYRH
ncbi:MAG: hypothetical protein JWR21_2403 [Herminiimonas sp.]|nr:hypothetical protein [Herminiimonas sp.]MDB5852181.1 hypothetical protein [Herminiimonas sp.]